MLLALFIAQAGCGGYGPVSSVAFDYAAALYSICSRQTEDQLDAVGEQLAAAQAAGQLNETETRWLLDIVPEAQSGQWESARDHARRMMQDQSTR